MKTTLQILEDQNRHGRPIEMSYPRNIEESRLFRSLTQKWHDESNSHRPKVNVYRGSESSDISDVSSFWSDEEFDTIRVDCDGLLEEAYNRPFVSRGDYYPSKEFKLVPYEIDFKTFYIAKVTVNPNLNIDQVEKFSMLLESHENCRTDDFEPFNAKFIAERIAALWANWSVLDLEMGVSVGSFLIAAQDCGFRINSPITGHERIRALEAYDHYDDRLVSLMLRKSWVLDPFAYEAIERPSE